MTSRSAARRRGREAEKWAAEYARNCGFDSELIPLAGQDDQGDLFIRGRRGIYVVQSKARKGLNIQAAIRDAGRQASSFSEARGLAGSEAATGVLLWRPYGYGHERIADWTIAYSFRSFLEDLA